MNEILSIEEAGPYYEFKYEIPQSQYETVKQYLDHYYVRPPQYGTGTNVTLYYDTATLKCFHEGKDGVAHRQKLRLREYESKGTHLSFGLECKERQGNAVKKYRVRFRSQSEQSHDLLSILNEFDTDSQRQILSPFRDPIDSYFPRVSIQYSRERYICPHSNLRLNIDSNIQAGYYYLNRHARVSQRQTIPTIVLELKSDHPPRLPRELNALTLSRTRLSKYTALIEKSGLS